MKASVRDDWPVVFIQHRLLHPLIGEVPDGDWIVPLGVADVKREGTDITIVANSFAVSKALEAAEKLEGEISVEVVDPRTLVPMDLATILESTRKTGCLLVVHDAPERGGFGAEVVRQVVAEGIGYFKAAPRVLGGRNIPMPYSPPLEDACIPQVADIVRIAREMVAE